MENSFISKEKLHSLALGFGVNLDETALERFDIYAKELVSWNEKINLTAISDPDGIVIKHFADSLSIFNYVDFPNGAKVIDVGTGAGFPGIVLKIMCPSCKVTLLDSLNKRIKFLNEVISF